MRRIIRIVVPFASGMIYIQSGFSDIMITNVQELNWMILGAIASIPSYVIYLITE